MSKIQEYIKEICTRYREKVLASNFEEPTPNFCSSRHILIMIDSLELMHDIEKLNRWLGYIQGVLAAREIVSIPEEMEFIRNIINRE